MKKSVKIFLLVLYIGLFVTATFMDLRISQYATAHAETWYTASGDRLGSVCPELAAGLGCAGLYHSEKESGSRKRFFWALLLAILSIVAGYMLIKPENITVLTGILAAGLGCAVFFLLFFGAGKMTGDIAARRRVCAAVIIETAAAMIIVNILKLIWARPRYIYMSDPETQFVPWYVLSGPKLVSDAYKSFPSAHTVSACTLLGALYLPYVYPKLRGHEKTLTAVIWIVILYVAVSRIFAGMHFMSDTLGGIGVGVLVYMIVKKRYIAPLECAGVE